MFTFNVYGLELSSLMAQHEAGEKKEGRVKVKEVKLFHSGLLGIALIYP